MKTGVELKLTNQMKWILGYLRGAPQGDYTPPTQIGRSYRAWYHSSWASPKLKKLKEYGFVERNDKGHWRLTEKGRAFASNGIADDLIKEMEKK